MPQSNRPPSSSFTSDASSVESPVTGISVVLSTTHSVDGAAYKDGHPRITDDLGRGDSPLPAVRQFPNLSRLLPSAILVAITLISGFSIPCLGAVNSAMGQALGSPYWAVQFMILGSGVACVPVALLTGHAPPLKDGIKNTQEFVFERWYHFLVLIPGLLSVEQNIIATNATRILGSGLCNLGILFGQILGASLLDFTGWAWGQKVGMARLTMLGAAVVTAGCVLYQTGDFIRGFDTQYSTGQVVLWVILSVCMGFSICFQSSFVQKLSTLLGRSRRACGWCYGSGAFLALIPAFAFTPHPDFSNFHPKDIWTFTAVIFNVYTLWAPAYASRRMSFAKAFSFVIVGQLIGAALIDGTGMFGVLKKKLTYWTYIGIIVVLSGVFLVAYGRHRLLKRKAASEQAKTRNDSPYFATAESI